MKASVVSLDNKALKEIELPDAVFNYPYVEHLIHIAVVAVQAARRRGTHQTKSRSEVAGSGRKLYRQKGTGRSRVGSLRTPLWRKGGVVHGPKTRDHSKSLAAREKRNALKSALSRKLAEEAIVIVESLELETYRTSHLAHRLDALGVDSRVLVVDRRDNTHLKLAARNNPRVKVVDALAVNVYDVVDRPYLVMSQQAVERLTEVLSK